jgi:hypothetical protein
MRRALLLGFAVLIPGCGPGEGPSGGEVSPPDTLVRVIPRTPIETGLLFSNALIMNDPACMEFLSPELRDSLRALDLSPWELFGRWRAFDSNGRLTEIVRLADGESATSYYCAIARLGELPPVVRMDFLLHRGEWLISGFGYETQADQADSLALEHQVSLILADPALLREMRIARMLLDDILFDASWSWSSWEAARASGESFPDYISGLSQESYDMLAKSNIRQAGKLQIIQDRATFQIASPPLELRELVAAWRELAYLRKAVLRARHEAMQNLRQTGVWMEPELGQEDLRIQYLEGIFMPVSDLVESRDTLSRTYPAMLTAGSGEPLEAMAVELDPHVLEQKTENDIGVPVWRALGVDMNGDPDPERMVYWAGDLFLFMGTPTGYRLVFRTFDGYDSDYHGQFGTVSSPSGHSGVGLIGNRGDTEYNLFLDGSAPRFTATPIQSGGEADMGSYPGQAVPEDY